MYVAVTKMSLPPGRYIAVRFYFCSTIPNISMCLEIGEMGFAIPGADGHESILSIPVAYI